MDPEVLKKIQRIAEREGLIIIGIAAIGFIIAFTGDYIWQHSKSYMEWMPPSLYEYEPLSIKLLWHRACSLFKFYNFPAFPHDIKPPHHVLWSLWSEHLGEFIFLYGYLLFFSSRLIVRVIKTRMSYYR